jgi:hypothetical protein
LVKNPESFSMAKPYPEPPKLHDNPYEDFSDVLIETKSEFASHDPGLGRCGRYHQNKNNI